MFGFRRKKKTIMKFLDKVDDEYMLSIKHRDVTRFNNYADKNVYYKLLEMINSDEEKFFGLPKYRRRTWQLLSSDGPIQTYYKTITHENIKIHHNISIPLGDFISEIWVIDTTPNKFKIMDIRRALC